MASGEAKPVGKRNVHSKGQNVTTSVGQRLWVLEKYDELVHVMEEEKPGVWVITEAKTMSQTQFLAWVQKETGLEIIPSQLRYWRKQDKEKLVFADKGTKKIGCGRVAQHQDVEDKVLDWLHQRYVTHIHIIFHIFTSSWAACNPPRVDDVCAYFASEVSKVGGTILANRDWCAWCLFGFFLLSSHLGMTASQEDTTFL
jgi:hypothetical protein